MEEPIAAQSALTTPPGADEAPPAALPWTRRLWPASAFLCWLLGWLLLAALQPLGPLWALVGALLPIAGLAWLHERRWRRFMVLGGFAASLLLHRGLAGLPAWCWLLPLALLLLMYRRSTWRDAPLFPTPAGALAALGVGDVLLLDPRRVTLGLREKVGAGARVVEALNPSTLAKSRPAWARSWCAAAR